MLEEEAGRGAWQGGQQPACSLGPRTLSPLMSPWGGGEWDGARLGKKCLPRAWEGRLPTPQSHVLPDAGRVVRPVRHGHSPHSSPGGEAGLRRSPAPTLPQGVWLQLRSGQQCDGNRLQKSAGTSDGFP